MWRKVFEKKELRRMSETNGDEIIGGVKKLHNMKGNRFYSTVIHCTALHCTVPQTSLDTHRNSSLKLSSPQFRIETGCTSAITVTLFACIADCTGWIELLVSSSTC
jgi:hypothetical protein